VRDPAGSHRDEEVVGGAQLLACVDSPVLPAEPLAVDLGGHDALARPMVSSARWRRTRAPRASRLNQDLWRAIDIDGGLAEGFEDTPGAAVLSPAVIGAGDGQAAGARPRAGWLVALAAALLAAGGAGLVVVLQSDSDAVSTGLLDDVGGVPVLAGAYRTEGELADGLTVPSGTALLGDSTPTACDSQT
jgi:hypothetical protein